MTKTKNAMCTRHTLNVCQWRLLDTQYLEKLTFISTSSSSTSYSSLSFHFITCHSISRPFAIMFSPFREVSCFRSLHFSLWLFFGVHLCVILRLSLSANTRAPHENFWLVIDFLSFRLFNTVRPYNRFWWTGTGSKHTYTHPKKEKESSDIDYLQIQRVHAMRIRRMKDVIRLLISLLF